MPLDPSIIMRGTELQMAQSAQRDQQIASFFDKLTARKLKKEEDAAKAAKDYEGAYMQVLKDQAAGVQSPPEIVAMAKAHDRALTAQNAINPTSGEAYPKNRSIFEVLGVGSAGMPIGEMPAMDVTQEITGKPYGAAAMPPQLPTGAQELPNVFDNLTAMPKQAKDQSNLGLALPMPKNAKQDLERYGAELDIAKQGEIANIEASQAGAKKASELQQENRVNTELRNKGLTDLTTNINKLIEDAKGTPNSFTEGLAASATSLAGMPNKQAVQRAKFTSGKAISGLQSRIAFLKGQGTITDAEATQAMAFLPEPNDPIEIKLVKLEAAKEYMSGLMGEATKINTSKPGFKYLGKE